MDGSKGEGNERTTSADLCETAIDRLMTCAEISENAHSRKLAEYGARGEQSAGGSKLEGRALENYVWPIHSVAEVRV